LIGKSSLRTASWALTSSNGLSSATKGSGLDDLARAAAGPGKGGQTAVGHALQKHGDRPGSGVAP
jgi:hypothetical protein